MEIFDWVQGNPSSQAVAALQVCIASVLGGVIGLERELVNRPAGLRTHALLAGAAALFVLLAENLVFENLANTGSSIVRTDPIRVLEAVVVGVAFLGAGTIFRTGPGTSGIAGLTTGTSLMLVAGIGIAVALGMLLLAVLVTVMALVLLHWLVRFEK